jgi:hypothetical protein
MAISNLPDDKFLSKAIKAMVANFQRDQRIASFLRQWIAA